jgi:hypothetical protein
MRDNGPVFCGDGNPSSAMLHQKETNAKYNDKNFLVMNGGVHTMLEIHHMQGRMFGSAHMIKIWSI